MRIAIISPYAPAPGADNAGAALVAAYVSEMSNYHDVVVLTHDLDRGLGDVHQITARPSRVPNFPLSRALPDIAFGIRVPDGFAAGLAEDARALQILAAADLVELQFAQMLPLLQSRHFGNKPVAAFLHDVLSQSLTRLADSHPDRKQRLRTRARLPAVRYWERRLLERTAHIVVLSQKDRSLLPSELQGRTSVLLPFTGTLTGDSPGRRESTASALILGAMWRPENHLGALWFADRAWPKVRQLVPQATLRIVGSRPPPILRALNGVDGIEVVGWVDNLEAEFARSDCMVAPLLHGAGVKIKVLQAFAARVPVVATPIAAEGTADLSAFAAVSEDPDVLAEAVARLLLKPWDSEALAGRAFAWLKAQPMWSEQIAELASTYESLS